MEQAIARNPYHPGWYLYDLAFGHFVARRYQDAVDALERRIPRTIGTSEQLALCYAMLGREAELRPRWRSSLRHGRTFPLSWLRRSSRSPTRLISSTTSARCGLRGPLSASGRQSEAFPASECCYSRVCCSTPWLGRAGERPGRQPQLRMPRLPRYSPVSPGADAAGKCLQYRCRAPTVVSQFHRRCAVRPRGRKLCTRSRSDRARRPRFLAPDEGRAAIRAGLPRCQPVRGRSGDRSRGRLT